MVDGILSRHGIARQVEAAQIIQTANDLLLEMLSETAKRDVRALSFKDGVLTLACKHTVATYDAEGVGPLLSRRLEECYPATSFNVITRLRPEAFNEGV